MSETRYALSSYGDMITCEPRMAAFDAALRSAVVPGCTVLDIGAGPGAFSLLACRYGAGKVVAIEPDASLELLRSFAEANGCADRIEVVRGLSTDYSPSGRADVIISDLRGALPLFEGHIAAIVDARTRLLAPGGTLIPARDTLYLALVESAETYRAYEQPWVENRLELDLSAAQRFAGNAVSKVKLGREALVGDPAKLGVLDYYEVVDPDLSGQVELAVPRQATIHGLLGWFDSELAPGIGFSNAPGEPPLVYGQTFFPFPQPLTVSPGDRVDVDLSARLVDGEYIWSWTSSLWRPDAKAPEASFRQSTFFAKLFSNDELRASASDFTPPRTERHDLDSYCISLIDGSRTQGEIAQLVRERFPARFPAAVDALNHVVRLTRRYR